MKTQSSHAAVASLIRAELKRRNIKASVRASSFAGGNDVTVHIQQDVTPAERAEIEQFCAKYKAGHFDSMTDMYEYTNNRDDIPQVKYLFVEVRLACL